ncbi:MAG TPA: A/G-specific adenine glycosylase [Patescibacteria group bacterium]
MTLTNKQITHFQRFMGKWYIQHGRHELPWRQTTDPYQILVSEIMLQQTQVDRVIPKYLAFLDKFSTVEELAQASVADVIKHWQGLGYNRRGLNLQRAAQQMVNEFNSTVPSTTDQLLSLKGIGPYTAAAIQAFAFNLPSTVIETNIRTVFIYHFFPTREQVSDQELRSLIESTLDQNHPRQWYSALMDYGTYLKSVLPNPTRQSKTYRKQSPLAGSLRQVRGQVLNVLTLKDSLTYDQLREKITGDKGKLLTALSDLEKEGFIQCTKNDISLLD